MVHEETIELQKLYDDVAQSGEVDQQIRSHHYGHTQNIRILHKYSCFLCLHLKIFQRKPAPAHCQGSHELHGIVFESASVRISGSEEKRGGGGGRRIRDKCWLKEKVAVEQKLKRGQLDWLCESEEEGERRILG